MDDEQETQQFSEQKGSGDQDNCDPDDCDPDNCDPDNCDLDNCDRDNSEINNSRFADLATNFEWIPTHKLVKYSVIAILLVADWSADWSATSSYKMESVDSSASYLDNGIQSDELSRLKFSAVFGDMTRRSRITSSLSDRLSSNTSTSVQSLATSFLSNILRGLFQIRTDSFEHGYEQF